MFAEWIICKDKARKLSPVQVSDSNSILNPYHVLVTRPDKGIDITRVPKMWLLWLFPCRRWLSRGWWVTELEGSRPGLSHSWAAALSHHTELNLNPVFHMCTSQRSVWGAQQMETAVSPRPAWTDCRRAKASPPSVPTQPASPAASAPAVQPPLPQALCSSHSCSANSLIWNYDHRLECYLK